MSNAYLCPILQQNQFTDNANFLAGGLIWSYVAGTTTPQAVYTDSTANTAWPNPIVLNQRGETGGEIWLAAGSSYKFVIEDAPFTVRRMALTWRPWTTLRASTITPF